MRIILGGDNTDDKIRTQFLEMYDDKLLLIDYLKFIIANKAVADFEDIGFCYWNISDSYALLKDGRQLFDNHKTFYDYVKNYNDNHLLWLVCDATQKLTLEHYGYGDFWWQIYKESIAKNQKRTNHFALFCAHRAALYTNKTIIHTKENLDFAANRFHELLKNAKNTNEYLFYKTVYLSLISRFLPFDKNELKHLCEHWFCHLAEPKSKNQFLIGEWQSFITPFDKRKQAEISINSVINAFIYNDEQKLAKHLYQTARDFGLSKNLYIEKVLLKPF